MTIDLSKLLSLKTPASGAAKVGEAVRRSNQQLIIGTTPSQRALDTMLQPDLAEVANINEEIERRLSVALVYLLGHVLEEQPQACWGTTPAVYAL